MRYARNYLYFIRGKYMFFQPHFLHFMTMNSVLVKHCHSATLNIMLIARSFECLECVGSTIRLHLILFIPPGSVP